MIALADVTAEAGKQCHGFAVLNAFGDRDGAEAVRKIDRRFDHFEVPLRIAHRHHESLVDLDFVGFDLGQIFKVRSEEHTSELQSLMRISYAVFCLKKKTLSNTTHYITHYPYLSSQH